MQSGTSLFRSEEPFRRTLARSVTIAAGIALAVALVRHEFRSFFPVAILALWPSLGGHYVELLFWNGFHPRVPPRRLPQAIVRLLVWFASGILLYLCMVATAHALPIKALPLKLWWCGGFLFVGVELAVHAFLAIRGLPNFYKDLRDSCACEHSEPN